MSAAPDRLDAGVVLRRASGLEWRDVEGEAVVWHAGHEQLHRLDRVGTLVFQLCDGVTPLAVTVSELAETFGDPPGLEQDVHELVALLLRVDLLEHV